MILEALIIFSFFCGSIYEQLLRGEGCFYFFFKKLYPLVKLVMAIFISVKDYRYLAYLSKKYWYT